MNLGLMMFVSHEVEDPVTDEHDKGYLPAGFQKRHDHRRDERQQEPKGRDKVEEEEKHAPRDREINPEDREQDHVGDRLHQPRTSRDCYVHFHIPARILET